MYEIGDYVVKANVGVCRVKDIMHLESRLVDNDKLYYFLVPLENETAKIYVPVTSDSAIQRKALSSGEAWELIHKISEIESISIENEKTREQKYKEALASCNPELWVSIIKTMYQRKQKRSAEGKKGTAVDEHYFRNAENYLYSELAFAIGKERNEMCRIIEEVIQKQDMNVEGH